MTTTAPGGSSKRIKTGDFYGSNLSRPYLVLKNDEGDTDIVRERVDAPLGVNAGLIDWARKVPYKAGGLKQSWSAPPRNQLTAFNAFRQKKEQELLKQHFELRFLAKADLAREVFRAAQQEWKELDDEARAPYVEQAKGDFACWEADVDVYEKAHPGYRVWLERRAAAKEAAAAKAEARGGRMRPRGRLTAYRAFLEAQIARRLAEEPGLQDKSRWDLWLETTKMAAGKWKELSKTEKAQYIKLAEEDKERYERELASFPAFKRKLEVRRALRRGRQAEARAARATKKRTESEAKKKERAAERAAKKAAKRSAKKATDAVSEDELDEYEEAEASESEEDDTAMVAETSDESDYLASDAEDSDFEEFEPIPETQPDVSQAAADAPASQGEGGGMLGQLAKAATYVTGLLRTARKPTAQPSGAQPEGPSPSHSAEDDDDEAGGDAAEAAEPRSPTGAELVGRHVYKRFGNLGNFPGRITSFGPFYRIDYEDGDWEEVEEFELKKILMPAEWQPSDEDLARCSQEQQQHQSPAAGGDEYTGAYAVEPTPAAAGKSTPRSGKKSARKGGGKGRKRKAAP